MLKLKVFDSFEHYKRSSLSIRYMCDVIAVQQDGDFVTVKDRYNPTKTYTAQEWNDYELRLRGPSIEELCDVLDKSTLRG